MTGTMLEQ